METEKVKLSLSAEVNLICRNPKEQHPKKKTIRINEFNIVAWYKITIQKSVEFLHTNNKLPTKKIKETILFTIAFKTT